MDDLNINWFPGHMTKALRMMRANLKLVDVVIELLDARIPASSANPVMNELLEGKPRIVALNKADLADPEWTKKWINHFNAQGLKVVPLDSLTGSGTKALVSQVEQLGASKAGKLVAKGVNARAVRAMILGIPNVGKSSLINKLKGVHVANTADRPGVTRGKQWIKIGRNLELLDTPGVLWPKFEDREVGFRLAITGAIKEDIYDIEKVMVHMLSLLRAQYSERLIERYNLASPLPEDATELLDLIGKRRGCLRSGGLIDYDKTRRLILREFRDTKLGKFTLDRP
ncbi:MAG: ribosome biosis GTP-binding protein YlqF [Firmicutes bacterium]|nr:ribosome biosis GTP-binding protein YlqF [Bacillota bacterium]